MSKNRKWINTAVMLLAAGVLLCGISFVVLGFDFRKLATVTYQTNTYEVRDVFQNISIAANIEDISFVPSDDSSCRIVCREEEDAPHQVNVRGNTLTIENENKKGWHLFSIGFAAESPEITVFLPESSYGTLNIDGDTGNVKIPKDFTFENISVILDTGDTSCLAQVNGDIYIKTDTGHISISDVSAHEVKLSSGTGRIEMSGAALTGDLNIKESTGKVTLTDISCKNLTSDGSTGSMIMTNVIAVEEFNLERSTGDITFHGCDAGTIYVRTDTGDVTGTLLTDKVFLAETDTGDVKVPKTVTGGRCEISTDTGDISIEIR